MSDHASAAGESRRPDVARVAMVRMVLRRGARATAQNFPGGLAVGHMLSNTVTGDARLLDPSALGDHVDRLFRAAWALCGKREDAEDLVQETFARVLAKPRLLRGDDDLGYLLRVMHNTFISRHRARGRRPRETAVPEDLELADPVAGRRPEEAVAAREVFAHIAALPDAFRDALVAVDVAGLSYAEASRALGVKQATITSRLFRARAQVAAGMDPQRAGVLRDQR
jgi:RNA polymerase sigma-70 factor, ECF subfamily